MITPTNDAQDRAALSRALRDLEAARARVERDAARVYDETRSKLVSELLPVLDNLDRTIRATRDEGRSSLVEGVELVRAQLENVLRSYGVERIAAAVGARFDPAIHEAVLVTNVHDSALHGVVLAQTEAGYRFGDRLLRPAKVIVGD